MMHRVMKWNQKRISASSPMKPYSEKAKLTVPLCHYWSLLFKCVKTIFTFKAGPDHCQNISLSCKDFYVGITEVLEGLVSTSKWPRNEAKFLASSRTRPRKTRIKSLVLKMAEKRPKFWGIPRPVLKNAEEKGKIPHLVSSSTSEKFYQRSHPWPRPR